MKFERSEYLEICREMFDFVLNAAEVYKKIHPEKSYSAILRHHTLFSYLMRKDVYECTNFPVEAEEFMAMADEDFAAAGKKYKEIIPQLASLNAEGVCKWHPEYGKNMSLRWSPPHPDLPENWCIFHMWNGCRPKSFLEDKKYFANCFLTIMDESVKKYPQYDTLYTFSWLLSEPRFKEFFPQEWHDNITEPVDFIAANLGFLGQFLTARMTLNRRTAAQYLESGKLPYLPRSSHCSFTSMKKHLQENILN